MNWLTDVFAGGVEQRALLAGLLTVLASSTIGTWVVLRGMTFLGDAFAHGIIPGIAVALLFGFNPLIGALIAALFMGLAITGLSSRPRVGEDTSVGLLFVGMLALGIAILSRSEEFEHEVHEILFGDLLHVSTGDLVAQAIGASAVLLVTIVMYRPFLALTFNREKASTLGLHPTASHAILMALLALSIVVSFHAIGTLLVFAMLIGPPAGAIQLSNRLSTIMAISVGLGSASVLIGLIVSQNLDISPEPTIATTAVALFFIILAGKELSNSAQSRLVR